jgi:orotate phosphoribosyltransferase-like protein
MKKNGVPSATAKHSLSAEDAAILRQLVGPVDGHKERLSQLSCQIRQLEVERSAIVDSLIATQVKTTEILQGVAKKAGIDLATQRLSLDLGTMTYTVEEATATAARN